KVTFTAKPTLTVEKVVENGGRYGDLSDIAFSVLAQQSGDQMNNVDFTPLFAGPSNTRTKDLVAGTTYTMQESSNPRGFELKDISCHEGEAATSDASSDTATFTPQPNEHWYCTVTNVYNPPTVTVNKVVVDAAGNVVTPKDGASFTANLTGTPSITGLVANGAASAPRTLDAGTTYTLAEGAMPNANYAAKGAPVCTLTNPVEQTPAVVESANTFTPGLGDIWNCTITNVYTPPVTPPAPPVTPPAPPVTPEGTPAPEVDANAVAPRPAKAVLAITKTGPKKAQVMKAFTYTIRVRNTSTTVARNVIVRDTLPAGMIKISTSPKATQKGRVLTIKLGNLKPKATRTITVKVKFAANVRGARTNIATASADNAKTVKAKATTKVTAPAKRVVKPAVTG
ncbi:MAG TPA: hypothetical protein PKE32_01900, partial [Miltoncostaeaceae bacterium]|nr:hypothetical protein [Miltoncostaeaceae bacterium]